NTFNIGADLGMMAKASQLLAPHISFTFLVILFTLASLWMQIVLTYKEYAKYLKWLALVLFVYVFAAFAVNINWAEAIKHLIVPEISFHKEEFLILTAILGTT